jgi:hypothetical protein
LEFVDFGLEETVLDGLDDVALHLALVDLQDLGDLGVARHLDAVEDAGNGLDLDVSLQLSSVHSRVSKDVLLRRAVGFEITEKQVLEEGVELIGRQWSIRSKSNSFLGNLSTLEQFDDQGINFRRGGIGILSLEQALHNIMLP